MPSASTQMASPSTSGCLRAAGRRVPSYWGSLGGSSCFLRPAVKGHPICRSQTEAPERPAAACYPSRPTSGQPMTGQQYVVCTPPNAEQGRCLMSPVRITGGDDCSDRTEPMKLEGAGGLSWTCSSAPTNKSPYLKLHLKLETLQPRACRSRLGRR